MTAVNEGARAYDCMACADDTAADELAALRAGIEALIAEWPPSPLILRDLRALLDGDTPPPGEDEGCDCGSFDGGHPGDCAIFPPPPAAGQGDVLAEVERRLKEAFVTDPHVYRALILVREVRAAEDGAP